MEGAKTMIVTTCLHLPIGTSPTWLVFIKLDNHGLPQTEFADTPTVLGDDKVVSCWCCMLIRKSAPN